jgi:hypothetical protein
MVNDRTVLFEVHDSAELDRLASLIHDGELDLVPAAVDRETRQATLHVHVVV